jgi:signal transduction histidine kinase
MSHELRTPLNSIIGFTEILQDSLYGELNEKQREYLGYINASGRHLLELINDILDLSKVESGKAEVILSSFSVRALLDFSVTMLREKAMKHSIALECSIAPEADIKMVSDEHKIKQIVFNLLSNAVKFTPDGGRVQVDARRTGEAGSFIEISVSDTGIGIKKDDLDRLFKEFSQLDSPLQKRYEGTGLGLALSKRLVEMLGGAIDVRSEEGEGSVFSITIPLDPREIKRDCDDKGKSAK